MKEYVLLFRIDIATESELADGGNHFSKAGKLLGPRNTIIDGPYTANKQSVAGYIIILAKDMDDAISIAEIGHF